MSDETVLSDEERFEALLSADSEPIEETVPVEEVGQADEEEAEEVCVLFSIHGKTGFQFCSDM